MAEKILNRKLTHQEEELVNWLIKNGQNSNESYLDQVNKLRVAGYCNCGCASIDFLKECSSMNIISDYLFKDENNKETGIFLFAEDDKLAGLELYSLEAEYVPQKLPKTDWLYPVVFEKTKTD
tara:strand:+ start:16696 stop:17064 length:369 start_codon:yes stop_codon:yes gene_type:complete